MGLRWEFSWPKLWERKGHRCAGLPRTLICPVWVFSPSQLSAVQLWNPFIKEACGCVCLLVNAYYTLAGAGWLTETAARNQPCITESAHPKAWAHLCPGEQGWVPPRPGRWGLRGPVQEPTRPRQGRRRRWSRELEKCVILEWLPSLFSNKR